MKSIQSSTPLRLRCGGLSACLCLVFAACGGEEQSPSGTGAPADGAQTAPTPPSAEVALASEEKPASSLAAPPAAAPSEGLAYGASTEGAGATPPAAKPPLKPALPSATAGAAWPRNAKLAVQPMDHDFGRRFEGETLTHAFHMKSEGEGPLHISTAKPTCGCTVTKLEIAGQDGTKTLYNYGDPIPVGTEIELTALLDTKNKHASASSKINIACNDPRETVTLGLVAALEPYFNLAPNAIDFADISVDDLVEKTFEVSGKDAEPFALTLASTQAPQGMKIDLSPLEPGADGKANRWTVKVTIGPDQREGQMAFPITLRSDREIVGAQPLPDGTKPTYQASLLARANVKGVIWVDQLFLGFGLQRPGQVTARTVKLKSYDPAFTFGPVTAQLAGPNAQVAEFKWKDHFSTTVRPSEDGKSLDVELTCNGLPDGADGSWQGRMLIETGHPKKPEVAVFFSGICRSQVPVQAAPAAQPAPPAQQGGGW